MAWLALVHAFVNRVLIPGRNTPESEYRRKDNSSQKEHGSSSEYGYEVTQFTDVKDNCTNLDLPFYAIFDESTAHSACVKCDRNFQDCRGMEDDDAVE